MEEIITKQCNKCHKIKPLEYFYKKERTKDGRMNICITCKCEYESQRRKQRLPVIPPQSTTDAIDILALHGINTCVGAQGGFPYVDLVAFGVSPIEVKGAREDKDKVGKFTWGFTNQQKKRNQETHRRNGFVMCLAYTRDEGIRVFIIPDNLEWLRLNKKGKPRDSLSVTFGSNHHNAYLFDLLEPYENAFYLIEQARAQYFKHFRMAS